MKYVGEKLFQIIPFCFAKSKYMVDDTLGVTECGAPAVEKNAVINSLVEMHRLKMHEDKSCVIHVGNVKKCEQTCPYLKVHSQNMHDVKSSKYLGNVITSSGGV